ncbi:MULTISPECIES: Asp-tRNA(Asn)/Glu-tRNA(Gln) amidotransferase subunit GatC [Desulfofundulus]|uniref:Aspartyl/glutamyl-tRNA(Asn/Gln) amidotransferase subunit C n=1 Tax=Desulfofundulus salinus TaxID=2419843 RepID=A0A494WXG3_9FIRM|nr:MULTISPECIES: Asp-tRNA(Asn)/Glu-tRNA(Gln) amidotransferase subunit GatC [Desulfofundulus]NHM28289.1 Asp-tRNA(Asn)/Glu-tRNA(Gln) amidotransferase subunit GatC [Desulfofundulus sp. TPOSR]RKO66982.1 Asp-tRNA(Asn)/Glu-tRNA(Gln) amidotransferase subunit GatC [Desulfofundulus salinum]
MITIKDVEHVALLARLELNEEEKQMYTKQLNAILEYAQMLNELNTDDIPPTAHVLPLKNVWREDEVGEHLPPEEVLANAPETEGQFFKVPRIV